MSNNTLDRSGLETIESGLGSYNARDFFKYVRGIYLSSRSIGNPPRPNKLLDSLLCKISKELTTAPQDLWALQNFQLAFRATKPGHLKILGVAKDLQEEAEKAVKAGRIMSLLPYNAVIGDDHLIRKFLPSHPDKFSGKWRHSMDPYGIFKGTDQIVAVDDSGKQVYLATRKFPYAVLANITESCHIGCDGCYKGSMVRTSLSTLAKVYPGYAGIKRQLSEEWEGAVEKARLLTQWLNQNPEVDTVIISGGEPTSFSNQRLEGIVEQYKKARNIRVVRICTSSIFQGMWYRIDDDFVKILTGFKRETGKQFYVNAHVTDEFQLSAPEAKMAVDKLQRAGISIHLQMPLQEGINFKRDDLDWSTNKLGDICKQAYYLGVIPYKMIVDMHSPSHPDLTVPIETVVRMIEVLDEHIGHSDQERWQVYNVLHEQGNLYLYPGPHFTAIKEVDRANQMVTYFIPKRNVIHTYEEPLIVGHNDDLNSLNSQLDPDLRRRSDRVRRGYHKLKDKIDEMEASGLSFEQKARATDGFVKRFYRISGIQYPKNKLLRI